MAGHTSSARRDEAAIALAAALFTFLLLTKVSLFLWHVLIKGSRPLADIPPDGVLYLAGWDLMVCLTVAAACAVAYRLEPSHRPAGRVAGRLARGGLVAAIVVFCVASFQVARIYGEPLHVELLRSADNIVVLRESIWAYIGPMPALLLLYGLVGIPLVARPIERWLKGRQWLRAPWQLWGCIAVLCVGVAGMHKLRLSRIDTFGIKDNALVFFAKEYTPPYRPVDAPRLIAAIEDRLVVERRLAGSPKSLIVPGGSVKRDFPFSGAAGTDFNVILIQMESTGALHVDAQSAPNIFALAQRGLSFERHVTTATQTRPASIGLYYSDYMPELGTTPRLVYGRPMPQPALAEVLKQAGYQTGVFHTGFLDYVELRFLFENKGVDTLLGAREMIDAGAPIAYSAGVREETTVGEMCKWIRQQSGGKFFAAYLTEFPHHPYMSMAKEKPFPDDSWLNRYRNSLHYADQAVGKLVEFLKAEGLMEQTLIVVVGDHGETVSTYPVGHGLRVSAEEMRTPFVLHNPLLFPEPLDSEICSSHIDVAPTIVSLLGLQAPREWLGRNLMADRVPAVVQFVNITHIRRTCAVDNGLVYSRARNGSGYEMFELHERELKPLDSADGRRRLSAAYQEQCDWFADWSAWRHLKRAHERMGDLAQLRSPGGAAAPSPAAATIGPGG